mmetsp:Transcript_13043/g.26589  ORF Transcript_13043/g.26589 Transcript_13043/m.26589 type:complete len:418 (-) Transcript_13043:423-1676(-)
MPTTAFPAVAVTIMALCHTSATSLFVDIPQRLLIRAISNKGSACCSHCPPRITRSFFHSHVNKPAKVKFGRPSTKCHHSAKSRLFSSTFIPTQLDTIERTSEIATKRDLSKVLHTIEKAAQQAGELALQTAGKIAVKSTKTNSRDLVTESDLECQRIIKEVILGEFPTDVFLGEEDVNLSIGNGSESSSEALRGALGLVNRQENDDKLLFIVDPIDGTTNFQAGLPIYAVSIGVVSLAGESPEVVAGVIYNPALGEMTSAVRGRGCYLNNCRLNTDSKSKHSSNTQQPRQSVLGQSLINVGFPVCKESTLLASSRAVSALATKVRGLRMCACASQVIAWVAQSKFQAYFSWDLNAWDVAAGMLIFEESGGLVYNFDGTRADISSRDIIFTCRAETGEEGLLRDELIEVLRDNDCVEY